MTVPATVSASSAVPITTVGPDALAVGVYGAEGSELDAWPMYVEFRADGTGRLLRMSSAWEPGEIGFTYDTDHGQVTVTRQAGALLDGCDSSRPAVYDYTLEASMLVLTAVDEPCVDAMGPMPPHWRQLGHPLIEDPPGDDPVDVETALGTISWTSQPSPSVMWDPVRVSDGFIGIQSTTGLVRSSSDQREWTPIPNDLPRWLHPMAAVGDVIYAVGPVGTPIMVSEVYASNDGGTTWVNVPVETPTITCTSSDAQTTECWSPPGSELWALSGVAAGEGGVVIATINGDATGPDNGIVGPLFVLGDGVFERVDAPFTGRNGSVLVDAVGDGFYAHSRTGNLAWVSDDGRNWTEVSVPDDLQVLAVIDDTIHAVSTQDGVEQDVISTDGGRTWMPALERPPAEEWSGMVVGDHTFLIGSTRTDRAGIHGCAGVLWVSTDGQQWERALDIWPGTCTRPATVDGNTIVINAGDSNTWFGAIT